LKFLTPSNIVNVIGMGSLCLGLALTALGIEIPSFIMLPIVFAGSVFVHSKQLYKMPFGDLSDQEKAYYDSMEQVQLFKNGKVNLG